jgi:signal transduction histidine kinase
MRYSPQGGAVVVRVTNLPGSARISVSDNGPGIPLDEQGHVFERFYRGDKSRSRQGDSGSGLGLSIAEALVRAHAGEIGIESEPGCGTTVWFTVPASEKSFSAS